MPAFVSLVLLSKRRLYNKCCIHQNIGIASTGISVLVSLLQLRFQSAKQPPFETHRLHFIAFFIVILIFAVLLRIGIKLEATGSGCPAILSTVCLSIGYLSLIPLLWIIEPFIGWTALIVWFFFFVKCGCESYEELRDSIVAAVGRATSFLKALFNRSRNQNEEANISTNV
ncbi:hypothetical protein SLEP1_g26454 [Rubroshorea leprosula]|uniref:Uncharacterized protein n=1 Tax=Rubroshorea leprosula TaxID=152421 RepID=A0AAV5JWC2_9ROSI|nr:hypothetical protein SLEP1_g26454 [Rubroshorea leprosula]